MAKTKKKLMIPFTYGKEEMLSYCNYNYEEGSINSDKTWWDIEEDKQANTWNYRPEEVDYWTKIPNPDYEKQLQEYNNKDKEIQEMMKNGRYIEVDSIIWKENYEFEDTLYLNGMSRGRSAANFDLLSQTNSKSYNLFMTDIVDMVQNGNINKGIIKGRWTFVKRGSNYGIKLLESQ